MTSYIDIIGFIAGGLTIIALIPQIIRMFREENTKAVSLMSYSLTSSGCFLWVVYGIMMNNTPVIIANGLITCLLLTIVAKKIYNLVKKID